ncbi:efflux RND transporter periplasmic adaptor subunit [Solirubrum puertoriconensis]|uniref:efflux RND transporter periplasmic adaptor subunit n=1 Tax=Solirubrum puertoriconensis TaxID=1751427 RepID=UPI00098F8EE7|nr:efflux RND transporter periplasmic adaptor subunit [Solirubrum puertoriconensis]
MPLYHTPRAFFIWQWLRRGSRCLPGQQRRVVHLGHVLAVGGLLLLAACGDKEKEAEGQGASGKEAGPTPVSLVAATKRPAVYYDEYPATVVALNNVELRSQVAGFITGIFFKEGELVPKGKPLYEIDRRKYQAALNQAQANLLSAQAELKNANLNLQRYQRLAEQDAVARQILDNAVTTQASARAQVEVARAAVATARTDLDYSLINAPFTGRIGISQVRLGAQVSPGTTLLNTLSSEDPIGVDFVINEKELGRYVALQQEQRAGSGADTTFRLLLPDGKLYADGGRILAIDRGVDNQTGTTQVRVQFGNQQRLLKDGMSTVLRVLNRASGVQVVVPHKAILDQMGESFVFVVRDTVALQRKVELGPRLRDQIVVLKGLKEGEKIVTEGLQQLRDSAVVTLGAPKQGGGKGGPGADKAAQKGGGRKQAGQP